MFLRFLSVCLLLSASFLFAESPDIQGVRLGISLDEALNKIGPGFQVWKTKSTDGTFEIASASKARDNWVFQATGGKVIYLFHGLSWETGNEPDANSTKQRLYAKYGPPYGGAQPEWAWDTQEKPVSRGDMIHGQRCSLIIDPSAMTSIKTPSGYIGVPKGQNLEDNCSYILEARMPTGQKPDGTVVLMSFSMLLVDERPFYALAIQQKQANDLKQKQDQAKRPVVPF